MTESPYKKKLIEVALPLDAINAESAREKSIRHGHPSTLHLWWARRPLAACRAVLFSQLVDDPSAHPDRFPTEDAQDTERNRLFKIIEDLVKWENSTDDKVIEAARAEIRASCVDIPPPILDPFSGGGSIPLEARRLGLEAHASDLNPVAVLINKALIEIPARWVDQAPVFSNARDERLTWANTDGLAEDVRRYGDWIRDEAQRRIGHLYPEAALPSGGTVTVIAWIWARTVACPNPVCGATMPLVRSFWLSKKKGSEAWLTPTVQGRKVVWTISSTESGPNIGRDGTMTATGAHCLCCGEAVTFEYMRTEGQRSGLGRQLLAMAVKRGRKREFLPPDDHHLHAAESAKNETVGVPDTPLPDSGLGFRVQNYGLTKFSDLLTDRQALAISTLMTLVRDARTTIVAEGKRMGDRDAEMYATDVVTLLTLAISKSLRYISTLSTWRSDEAKLSHGFGSHTVPMVWDFAESNIFSGEGGDIRGALNGAADVIAKLRGITPGHAKQGDARTASIGKKAVICTDPPYYSNVGYADLSDLFYSWLRAYLGQAYPELFQTMVTPKGPELIADPSRHGSTSEAEEYFEVSFREVFDHFHSIQDRNWPLTVFYAFKQGEKIRSNQDLVSSTGWATILEAITGAGWSITATWPMVTEGKTRRRGQGSNALATSVVLVCRPRLDGAGLTDRQGFLRILKSELPAPLRDLQRASIAPVDLRQAAIGPGMAVFSRFDKVVDSNGESMRVRDALALINQVLDEILSEQESTFDSETRWAIQWFSQYFFDEGPYGVAEQLATAMNVSVGGMEQSGILRSGGGRVRLLGRGEYPAGWDPRSDPTRGTPVWEATQHLVKRLEEDGEFAAAQLLDALGGVRDSSRALAYRLYTICESARPNLAGPYNAVAASWTEMQRMAAESPASASSTAEQQSFDIT